MATPTPPTDPPSSARRDPSSARRSSIALGAALAVKRFSLTLRMAAKESKQRQRVKEGGAEETDTVAILQALGLSSDLVGVPEGLAGLTTAMAKGAKGNGGRGRGLQRSTQFGRGSNLGKKMSSKLNNKREMFDAVMKRTSLALNPRSGMIHNFRGEKLDGPANVVERKMHMAERAKLMAPWLRFHQYKLFGKLAPEIVDNICSEVQLRRFKAGDLIFLQGEIGYHYCIIYGGSVEFFIHEDEDEALNRIQTYDHWKGTSNLLGGFLGKKVGKAPTGGGFGELALQVGTSRRNASAVAAEDETTLITMSKRIYDLHIVKDDSQDLHETAKFIKTLKPFENWNAKRILRLGYSLKRHTYPRNHVIVKEGQPASELCIVQTGQVRLVQKQREVGGGGASETVVAAANWDLPETTSATLRATPGRPARPAFSSSLSSSTASSASSSSSSSTYQRRSLRRPLSSLHMRNRNVAAGTAHDVMLLGPSTILGLEEVIESCEASAQAAPVCYRFSAVATCEVTVLQLHKRHFGAFIAQTTDTSTMRMLRDDAHVQTQHRDAAMERRRERIAPSYRARAPAPSAHPSPRDAGSGAVSGAGSGASSVSGSISGSFTGSGLGSSQQAVVKARAGKARAQAQEQAQAQAQVNNAHIRSPRPPLDVGQSGFGWDDRTRRAVQQPRPDAFPSFSKANSATFYAGVCREFSKTDGESNAMAEQLVQFARTLTGSSPGREGARGAGGRSGGGGGGGVVAAGRWESGDGKVRRVHEVGGGVARRGGRPGVCLSNLRGTMNLLPPSLQSANFTG